MRVVARDAPQVLALLKADALLHLRRLSDGPNGVTLAPGLGVQTHNPDVTEPVAGTKVLFFATVAQRPLSSLKMTLIADRILTDGIQFGRIDDLIDQRRIQLLMTGDMSCRRSMTALASDGFFEEWLTGLKPVRLTCDGRHSTGVAHDAGIRNLAIKSLMRFGAISRRQIPPRAA